METEQHLTESLHRRCFLGRTGMGLGSVALASLLGAENSSRADGTSLPHFAARAKRVIYLFQSGAPSQLDLFDYKPSLRKLQGTELPDSIRRGQRLTGMTATQDQRVVASHRQSGR
jgi:hypothetical protein